MNKQNTFLVLIISLNIIICGCHQQDEIKHTIAAIEEGKFHGWPANNGIWQWENEILAGYTQGDFSVKAGHNISGIQKSLFSRSLDGGNTWKMFDPDNFLDDENIQWLPQGKKHLEAPLNFNHKGFALRFFATGYHGNDDPEGGFYYSYDRGSTWQGPYYLGGLSNYEELNGKDITARTDYIITGGNELYAYISANPKNDRNNRIACIKTKDGGMSFEFVSWVTPLEEDYNAIMSSTIQLSENKFVLAHRKRYFGVETGIKNTIEALVSEDYCRTWKLLGTVKYFENSSNPPALLGLKDGRLVCIYGDRDNSSMSGKYSNDGGVTWGEEFIIRDNFKDMDSTSDFGYPRLMQRKDGKLVAIYYWASRDNLQQHIAVSIWNPQGIKK